MAGAVPPHRHNLWGLLIHNPSGKILWGKSIREIWEELGLPGYPGVITDGVGNANGQWLHPLKRSPQGGSLLQVTPMERFYLHPNFTTSPIHPGMSLVPQGVSNALIFNKNIVVFVDMKMSFVNSCVLICK